MARFRYPIRDLAKRTARETMDDNLLGVAAETAWSFFFGLFPTVLFALPILSLIGDRDAIIDALFKQLGPALPIETTALIVGIVREIISTNSAPALMSIGLLLALWSSSSMYATLLSALNRAYEVTETRPWWRQRLIAAACGIGGVIVVWSASTIMLLGDTLIGAAIRFLGFGPLESAMLWIAQYLVSFLVIATFIWLLYVILPNRREPKRLAWVGAAFAALLWMAFTVLFRIYIQGVGAYNKAYGAIGGVMVLLTWMYWTVFMILLGGELNSELEKMQREQAQGDASSRTPA